MQETTTLQIQGSLFNDESFEKSKLQTFARRLQVKIDLINNETLQITGTWHAIAKFRQILNEDIVKYLSFSDKTALNAAQENHNKENVYNSASSKSKGVIRVASLSSDVLALMQKCGVFQNDHLTYDAEGGCVIIECPDDDKAASTIAEEFQAQYRQIMMGGKLREFSFPILNISNRQQVDELVIQFNNNYPQSVFRFDKENKVIKCLSMNARQLNHIRAKAKELLEKPDVITASGTVANTPTSMLMTLQGGRRITLKQANIVEEAVDVIVNAANDTLTHAGGVAAAINDASQNNVQILSNNLMHQRGGHLETSQVVHTGAGGALKCKYIIHTVGPEKYKHGNQCQQLLWMACMNTLVLAEKLKANSLAIPPISTGIFGVPKELVAKTIMQAVCSYPGNEEILQDVRIVIIDKETYEAFKPSFIDVRATCDVSVMATQPAIPFHQNHSWPSESNGDKHLPVPQKDLCPICKDNINDPVITTCQHKYCRGCLTRSLQASPYCPVCKVPLREITGDQPDGGKMSHQIIKYSLSGYNGFNTIKITYYIPSGIQGLNHPHPGRHFTGDSRYAYLPDSHEGREVLTLLRRAFDAKLIFTIGKSATTGRDNTIVWNDIHHKTSMTGGPQRYGYPDPHYLKRVKEELRQKGIY